MKAISCFVFMVVAGLLHANTQSLDFESDHQDASTSLVNCFNTTEDESYQLNVLSFNTAQFTSTFNVRVEDELTSETPYVWLKEVSFLNVNFTYIFKAFEFNMTLENLLGFNNNNFAIESNLEQGIGNMQNILFIHESDFLVSARIAYNF
jgi:hypothetical protein